MANNIKQPFFFDIDSGNIGVGEDTPIIKFKRSPKIVVLYLYDTRSIYNPMKILTLHQNTSKHIFGTNYVELQGKYLVFNMSTDGFSWLAFF